MGSRAQDLDDAVGAEGGDDVLGPAIVERVGVGGEGGPDERWGQVPVAFVVLRPGASATADSLLEHCRAELARFKVPKEITFLDALPRNPSGKVLKRDLRAGA